MGALTSRIIRIAGYRLKDGKLVRDARRLSVSDRLRHAGGKLVRVVPRVRALPDITEREQ
jgi:hypothetical protein